MLVAGDNSSLFSQKFPQWPLWRLFCARPVQLEKKEITRKCAWHYQTSFWYENMDVGQPARLRHRNLLSGQLRRQRLIQYSSFFFEIENKRLLHGFAPELCTVLSNIRYRCAYLWCGVLYHYRFRCPPRLSRTRFSPVISRALPCSVRCHTHMAIVNIHFFDLLWSRLFRFIGASQVYLEKIAGIDWRLCMISESLVGWLLLSLNNVFLCF